MIIHFQITLSGIQLLHGKRTVVDLSDDTITLWSATLKSLKWHWSAIVFYSVYYACMNAEGHIHVFTMGLCCVQPLEPPYSLEVPLGTIQRVEQIEQSKSKGENVYGLEICCKVCIHIQVYIV